MTNAYHISFDLFAKLISKQIIGINLLQSLVDSKTLSNILLNLASYKMPAARNLPLPFPVPPHCPLPVSSPHFHPLSSSLQSILTQ